MPHRYARPWPDAPSRCRETRESLPVRNTPVVSEPAAEASKASGKLQADGPRLTGRDIVIAIRRSPIALIEEVLDVELRLPGLIDRRKDPGVEAHEAGQVHGVVRRGERI